MVLQILYSETTIFHYFTIQSIASSIAFVIWKMCSMAKKTQFEMKNISSMDVVDLICCIFLFSSFFYVWNSLFSSPSVSWKRKDFYALCIFLTIVTSNCTTQLKTLSQVINGGRCIKFCMSVPLRIKFIEIDYPMA